MVLKKENLTHQNRPQNTQKWLPAEQKMTRKTTFRIVTIRVKTRIFVENFMRKY